MKTDKEFYAELVREFYPAEYWENHRRASIFDTHSNLKRYAKEVKVHCFNYMEKGDLVQAINRKQAGLSIEQLEEKARRRFPGVCSCDDCNLEIGWRLCVPVNATKGGSDDSK